MSVLIFCNKLSEVIAEELPGTEASNISLPSGLEESWARAELEIKIERAAAAFTNSVLKDIKQVPDVFILFRKKWSEKVFEFSC